MDLYVERQCVDQMKESDPKKFMMLFDANFENVYKYVSRRVFDFQEVERMVKLTFLDAFGQIQNTPVDLSYTVWLYSLSKPRVANYINKEAFPKKQGLIEADEASSLKRGPVLPGQEGERVLEKSENMFKKLTMEEAEILRLKFFEELADGDVHFVIGGEGALIGSKIYRVLKRAHFLLFGESDERQGVYFGELSGFMERVKDSEKIDVPEAFKLSLRMEILNKLDRRESAMESPVFDAGNKGDGVNVGVGAGTDSGFDAGFEAGFAANSAPWEEVEKAEAEAEMPEATGSNGHDGSNGHGDSNWQAGPNGHTGSNDPAKIFVQAVKEMREEEEANRLSQMAEIDRTEKALEIFDKVKGVLVLIPVAMFLFVAVFVGKMLFFKDGKIDRGIKWVCDFETSFIGDFETSEKRSIDANISKLICEEFDAKSIVVERGVVEAETADDECLISEEGMPDGECPADAGIIETKIKLTVDLVSETLLYDFVRVDGIWKMTKYAKIAHSDTKSGKIQRNI